MYGLKKDEKLKEIIEKVDENTAIKYSVKEERIDLKALRQEKENLERELATEKPSDEELIGIGKAYSTYYNKDDLINRLEEIDKILG